MKINEQQRKSKVKKSKYLGSQKEVLVLELAENLESLVIGV